MGITASYVNMVQMKQRGAGYPVSVVTFPGEETREADTQLALDIVSAMAKHTRAICPLDSTDACPVTISGHVMAGVANLPKIELYALVCVEPCPVGLPGDGTPALPGDSLLAPTA